MEPANLISLLGIPILLGLGWALSENRGVVNRRLVLLGTALQLVLAAVVFVLPAGRALFLGVNDAVVAILGCASAGTEFLFGPLALPPGTTGPDGATSPGFILAFQALPTVIFFASLMALLYHVGIMPRIIEGFARFFTRAFGTSGAESLAASSNVFVGVESAFAVRPYLEKMTRSELCVVLTAGMSTIASSVLALYVFVLQGTFPTIAGHLVSASILSAPAALVMAKLLVPETGEPVTRGVGVRAERTEYPGAMAAIIDGAMSGLRLVAGIGALLLALLGLTALVNLGLGELGELVGRMIGRPMAWSLEGLLGLVAYPFALAMGIPPGDAGQIAPLLGQRAVLTEVPAYQGLAALMSEGALVHPRSAVIAAYGLCGFAHVASLAIFMGGVTALAPDRTADVASVAARSLVAATLATFVTGAVAGALYTGPGLLGSLAAG